MAKENKIVIVGDGEFAEIAFEYFTYDSNYKVVAFAVEKSYITKKELFNLPIVAFEEIERYYPPTEYKIFTAITFTKFNRVRTRLYHEAKKLGYNFVSYVSSKAFVWRNVKIGENCFIFENNTLQYHVEIGNNVIMWSGNHVGHRSIINDNCFISSHVVISGYCQIGEYCFLGVNSTLIDTIKIGENCFVAAGAVVTRSIEACKLLKGNPAKVDMQNTLERFEIKD
jgi:sugar O-acyltransferase (sialic acid O-acetyltransferase NeuD family)